ncbi:hypothetical protein VFPFJ_05018 [Purpureocillium lilacinum]|uniref:Uncharacterized protein n=1 Tax=Purpureocillium lilacinum TaxID=33203 RepID=A0A179HN23_PURLI|nr:hypothetical protein VFPFJ_05018 [Purpureocillium lilacinum]OAQ90859.1 hypothetical protein VFPFJ_05018 [Purpureocillium lilacinum]
MPPCQAATTVWSVALSLKSSSSQVLPRYGPSSQRYLTQACPVPYQGMSDDDWPGFLLVRPAQPSTHQRQRQQHSKWRHHPRAGAGPKAAAWTDATHESSQSAARRACLTQPPTAVRIGPISGCGRKPGLG